MGLVLLALLLQAAPASAAETVTVTVLATTDTHGFIYPWDYYARDQAPRGLAAAATLVAQARRESPRALLIDCGDTIQGSPLASVYEAAVRAGEAAGSRAHDARHEPHGLRRDGGGQPRVQLRPPEPRQARAAARFPWLSANTIGAAPPFAPYVVKTVDGVKVAIIGITTPAVPEWEKPEQHPRPLVAPARGGRAPGARGARAARSRTW